MMLSRVFYLFAVGVAIGLATWQLRRRQATLSLTPTEKTLIGLSGLVGATLAAKLPFVIAGSMDHGIVGTWFADGKTVLWGLVGGYVGVELAKWSLDIKTRTGDTFVVPVSVAVAVGRLGCLAQGCCYGIPTSGSWGIRFATAPDGGTLLRHPTQIYEIIFHLGFAMIAGWAVHRRLWQTHWMLIYLISYCVYRFCSEMLRPEMPLIFGFTFYQLSSVGIGVVFGWVLIQRIRRAPLEFSP